MYIKIQSIALSVLWTSLFLQASFKCEGPCYRTDIFSVVFGQQK